MAKIPKDTPDPQYWTPQRTLKSNQGVVFDGYQLTRNFSNPPRTNSPDSNSPDTNSPDSNSPETNSPDTNQDLINYTSKIVTISLT